MHSDDIVRTELMRMKNKTTILAVGRVICFCALALGLSLVCFRLQFNLSSATSVHLFLVVLIALRFSRWEASIVSIVSTGCLDYFFTEPVFHFSMYDYRNWIALATFELVALLIASLSERAILRAHEAEERQTRLNRLYDLSQGILVLDRNRPAEPQLVELIRNRLKIRDVALWNATDGELCSSGAFPFSEAEVCAAYFDTCILDESENKISRRVLRLGSRPIGALLLHDHLLDPNSVDAVATLTSIAIERARSFSSEANALAAKQSEELRSAILDGLAHSFKSPLTAIISSSSGLLAMNRLTGTEKSLVELIDHQAGNLAELTTQLLLTAQLDTETVRLKKRAVNLREFIKESVEKSGSEISGREISLDLDIDENAFADVDEQLLRLALVQILDNAVKYGLPDTPISVSLKKNDLHFKIAIRNEGSYILAEDREKIFERFYRCRSSAHSVTGTGVGLAVVKRIAEAHHGYTSAQSDESMSTTITIALPSRTNSVLDE